jgi:dihydrofolate synthase/folylpolyglutamate synthase
MGDPYSIFLDRLDALGLFHMDLTLARVEAFLARRGQPRYPVLHVVGTNGKGSTATILAELLSAHGLRAGLSTSPHFVSVRERVRVDGALLPEEAWGRLGARVFEQASGLGLTYFEVLTALSLALFDEAGVDVAVMEAGLGGRFDATNVLNPALTVFTPIGMDHMNVLGPTLEDIARDKAGAMRPGGVAVSAGQDARAAAVLEQTARDAGCGLIDAQAVLYYHRDQARLNPGPAGKRFVRGMTGLELGLAGQHQEDNARTALAAFHVWASRLRLPVSEDACRVALARAFVPGRMQCVADAPGLPARLVLDGGHNAHGLDALARALDSAGIRPGAVVFGCMADKPLAEMLPLVRGLTDGPIHVAGFTDNPRAASPADLAAQLGGGAKPFADVHAALAPLAGEPNPVLVCGSLYLLGEFYTTHPWLLEREASARADWRPLP